MQEQKFTKNTEEPLPTRVDPTARAGATALREILECFPKDYKCRITEIARNALGWDKPGGLAPDIITLAAGDTLKVTAAIPGEIVEVPGGPGGRRGRSIILTPGNTLAVMAAAPLTVDELYKFHHPASERILFEIALSSERLRQDQIWGGPDHDDRHSPRDWIAFICGEAGKAAVASPVDLFPIRSKGFERQMIQVAALANAAWEAARRWQVAVNGQANAGCGREGQGHA